MSKKDKKCAFGETHIWIAVSALAAVCLTIGGIMAALGAKKGNLLPVTGNLTFCALFEAGVPIAATGEIRIWDPQTWTIIPQLFCIGFALLRLKILPPLVQIWMPGVQAEKQSKVCNYIFELAASTMTLVLFSTYDIWSLLFNIDKYYPASAETLRDAAIGGNLALATVIWCYIVEMFAEKNMRFELQLHHVLTIMIIMWAQITADLSNMDPQICRTGVVLLLYMATEQNVFISMLLYYNDSFWPGFFRASAWFYIVTRLLVSGLSVYFWSAMVHEGMFNRESLVPNNWFVFGYWAFYLPAVGILTSVQVVSSKSLFGVARRVAEKAGAARGKRKDVWKFKLHCMYDSICKGGRLTEPALTEHLCYLDLQLVLPRGAYRELFVEMDGDGNGEVNFDTFYTYMRRHCVLDDLAKSLELLLLSIAVKQNEKVMKGCSLDLVRALATEHRIRLEKLEQLVDMNELGDSDRNNGDNSSAGSNADSMSRPPGGRNNDDQDEAIGLNSSSYFKTSTFKQALSGTEYGAIESSNGVVTKSKDDHDGRLLTQSRPKRQGSTVFKLEDLALPQQNQPSWSSMPTSILQVGADNATINDTVFTEDLEAKVEVPPPSSVMLSIPEVEVQGHTGSCTEECRVTMV